MFFSSSSLKSSSHHQFVTCRPPTCCKSSCPLLNFSNLLFDVSAAAAFAFPDRLFPELPFEKPDASSGPRSVLFEVFGSADREAFLLAGEPSKDSPCRLFDSSGFVLLEYDSSFCATSEFVPDFVYSFWYGALKQLVRNSFRCSSKIGIRLTSL